MLSEAEFEYAARSRGADYTYPWGNEDPTEQGLCDMAGNAIEWTADWFHNTYDDAPADGSAWVDPVSAFRVMRGGGVGSCAGPETRKRTFHEPEFWYAGGSVRCAREVVDETPE